jgi:Holliday junction resolvase RusA-like endonuclease
VVVVEFKLARPGGHWHPTKGGLKPSAPAAPRSKPDVDKLARTTLDALTGIAFDDDSRIVDLVTRKRYAEPGREGARITVEEWKA